MPVEQPTQNTETPTASEAGEGQQNAIHMESVNRIAKLPVVESTINAATNMYEKVKVIIPKELKLTIWKLTN